jgi:hypothetical protein
VTEATAVAQDGAAETLDLSGDPPAPAAPLPIGPQPYDPTRERERMRGYIAMSLLALLIGVIVAMLLGLATGRLAIEALEKVAAVILSPVIGLFGAVIGFYYGEQSMISTCLSSAAAPAACAARGSRRGLARGWRSRRSGSGAAPV